MKKWIFFVLIAQLVQPAFVHAAKGGIMQKMFGTLSGQVVNEAGLPLEGGVVAFFNTSKGFPPMIDQMHRVPDKLDRMGPDGEFKTKIQPGTYYMGAMVLKDPKRRPGPPREGEIFYFIRDEKGDLREFRVLPKEINEVGKIVGALPGTFTGSGGLFTVKGRLLLEGKRPFKGGVVLVKTDMNKIKPDFISARTDEEGRYSLQLPQGKKYYLVGREIAVGRPKSGTYVGTYGSTSPIGQGGALPVAGFGPQQPGDGRPQPEGAVPKDGFYKMVTGQAGDVITGMDIMLFKVPVPSEQRKKIQDSLGGGGEGMEEITDKRLFPGPLPAE